jgi:anaerobic ribonucleoside-triphosphate reductase activating protein
MIWHLNRIHYPVHNLGHGKRIGIWVQGCNLGCRNCISKTTWKKNGGSDVDLLTLFNWVSLKAKDFDGITISGGEPFQQYEALMAFLYLVKQKTTLHVHCYTGYYLHELEKLFPDGLYLQLIDSLTDGRYDFLQADNSGLKGSMNQTNYLFKNGIAFPVNEEMNEKKWSVHVSEEGRIFMAGIPANGVMNQLLNDLKSVGIKKTFK